MVGITVFILLCMFYPFLPGKFDPLAVTLSTMAQVIGATGLLLVPIGVLWLVHELRKRARKRRNLPHAERAWWFAVASLVAASIAAITVSLVALMSAGISLCCLTLALWFYIVSRLLPRLKRLNKDASENLNPAPMYLLFMPVATLFFQLTLAAPATEFSRNQAITRSAEVISEIEKHYAAHGRYPSSLLAVWKDYHPSVVGIEQFHYAPNGNAYNLFFEQPRFLFDNLGTREFVMYDKLNEHVMPSHAAWILAWSPEQLSANQGWYAVQNASSPHWKYFWFD
jgi:hypothetical protein